MDSFPLDRYFDIMESYKSKSTLVETAMSSEVPPEFVDHSYANTIKPQREENSPVLEESSSTELSTSEYSSSSSSDTETETKRTRAPPQRHIDSYVASTPKTSPAEKIKSPKRLSTSAGRKAKEPIRRSLEGHSEKKRTRTKRMSGAIRLRSTPCGTCDGCKREDCGECVYCKDKAKFGGPGKKKQKCLLRACKNMPSRIKAKNVTPPTSSAPSKTISTSSAPSKTTSASSAPSKTTSASSASSKATSSPSKKLTLSAKSLSLKQTSEHKSPQKQTTTPSTSSSVPPTSVTTAITNIAKQVVQSLTKSLSSASLVSSPSVSTVESGAITTSSASKSRPVSTTKVSPKAAKTSPSTCKASGVTAVVVKETATTAEEVGGAKKTSTRQTTTVTPAVSFKTATGWEMKMKCIQCNRERSLSMARTEKFCGQRCVLKWLEEHPDKTPKDAVGDSEVPLFALPTLTTATSGSTSDTNPAKEDSNANKPLSKVLKQLQIDMAPPGTRLQLSEDEESEDDSTPAKSEDSKTGKSRPTQPASSAAKRSVVNPQPPAIKKAKTVDKRGSMSPNNNSKSVKFDLNSTSISTVVTPPPVSFSQRGGLPGSISIVPLDRLSEFVREQQKKIEGVSGPKMEINLPQGLSKSVEGWSVDDVCTYFKATKECTEFGTIFKEQEVDGFALVRLTDQRLCQWLQLSLGKAIKVMAHVDELKKLTQN